MLWLFIGPTGVYLLNFFCSGIQFQGGTSFMDLFCLFFLSCVCYAFVHVSLYVPFGHLLGKDWPLGSSLRRLTVSLSHSHWYPGSGVVLDCIDSWSLHPYFNAKWLIESKANAPVLLNLWNSLRKSDKMLDKPSKFNNKWAPNYDPL